jgi:hypothetical protein
MSISGDLWFHLQGVDKPDDTWKHMKIVFGKNNEVQAHQLEKQLISLNPDDLSCIENYLSKFETLKLLLEDCNIEKKDD